MRTINFSEAITHIENGGIVVREDRMFEFIAIGSESTVESIERLKSTSTFSPNVLKLLSNNVSDTVRTTALVVKIIPNDRIVRGYAFTSDDMHARYFIADVEVDD
jgi:hypothetical protein